MIITDDLLVQMLAHTLARVDQADLTAAIHTGPARCATGWRHPDTWYRTDPPHRRGTATRAATDICRRCDVAVPCGLLALARREPWGIWGAMTAPHRRDLLHQLDQVKGTAPTASTRERN